MNIQVGVRMTVTSRARGRERASGTVGTRWRRVGSPLALPRRGTEPGGGGVYPIVTLENTATYYDRKPGIKWLSCTAK
jgi:hypothetical protein